MRMLDPLVRHQPLTKLGVTMAVGGLALTIYGWFWFSTSRMLLARGQHGIAEITEIRPASGGRRRMTLEMHTDDGINRITYYFRRRWNQSWRQGERISLVYLPQSPSVFQFAKEPYLNPYGLIGGLVMIVVGIILPIVEKRKEDAAGSAREYDDGMPLSETQERERFANLDLEDYQAWTDQLMRAGFAVMGNAVPVDVPTPGGRARLERPFRTDSAVAVLYVIQPGLFAQLTGGKQKVAVEMISLLADGTFIITTNHDSGHESLAQRENVSLVQLPDSLDADMLKQSHDVRLRENAAQRNTSVIPIQDNDEARKLLDGLAEPG